VIPTLPLRARDPLARTILAAFHDPEARARLAALAEGSAPDAWLPADARDAAPLVRQRAEAAGAALGSRAFGSPTPSAPEALERAAVLFDAGLGFEAHEVLEPVWSAAAGEEREALQGLIQVAVAFQHRANGNLAGYRSLLEEGTARLDRGRLPGLDLAGFARAALATAGDPTALAPSFPRPARAVLR
jgi:hypothetical protein